MSSDPVASLRSIPPLLRDEPAMLDALGPGSTVLAVPEAATAVVVAGLCALSERRPLVVATPTLSDAERFAHDLGVFLGENEVELFPPWDTLPFERVSPEIETMGRRLRLLWRLGLSGDTNVPGDAPAVVVAPVRALLQRLGPLAESAVAVRVRAGDRLEREELVGRLVSLGYRREYQVEHRGEIAVRGGIVDVFGSTSELPVRIDLFGDEVDRLTAFDPGDQRSVSEVAEVELHGCRELLPTDAVRARARSLVASEPWGRSQWERIAEGQLFDGMESWTAWLVDEEQVLCDVIDPGGRVVLVDPRRMRDRARELNEEEEALADALAVTWGVGEGTDDGVAHAFPRLHVAYDRLLERCRAPVLSLLPAAEGPGTPAINATAWDPLLADRAALARRLATLGEEGWSVTLCAESETSAARLASVLAEEGLSVPVEQVADPGGRGSDGRAPDARATKASATGGPRIRIVVAGLERGFLLGAAKVAVLAEPDLTGRRRAHRPVRARARPTDGFFDDLAPGDYVVHRQHGVARYTGMVTRTVNGASRDYLLLEYRGDDRLYLPSDQIDALTPYSGGEAPALNRLGGSEWQRTRARARAAVHEVAVELVELYRQRLQVRGHSFPPDTPWQRELEDSFGFVETADQLRAIYDVKADMESDRPMDRLVCGDVGFGKTEVAVRAAFKAVQDGQQAAILVPTTLLAQQHAQTFAERYSGYPVKVEMLSRFLTTSQARAVVSGIAAGSVDVVVGTHRMLAGDVRFKNLGLLVVDEEQRFGVSHKEAIKAISGGVDVLTLTANPIPRTLEMALTGIRDLSLINTPPAARQPILTYVGEFEEQAVVEAIRRELLREGQVFFVHNWVQNIEAVAARLRVLVPEARVAVAHGQMDEGALEQVVLDFWDGQYDVLVCTTIIESGIDMPTVNTLVVDRADRLGLGQLHQLRGRVGRAGHRAYAYLLHPRDRVLTEAAYERLRTIGEQTELGSGFKIAMRDLEIRGAGNLLGRDQSGHIAAVGYDLYVQMVAEAVAEMKGEQLRRPVEVVIDVPSDAHLPADYVAREDLRLEAYRRLASVSEEAEVTDVRDEWLDRFGPLPPPAEGLLAVGRLRVECLRTGVREVSATPSRPGQSTGRGAGPGRRVLVARLSPLELPASARVRLRRLRPEALLKQDARQLVVPLDPGEDPVSAITELLRELVPVAGATGSAPAGEGRSESSAAGARR
ncbi:MAG TPA: transcription-repair coupling factor [Acidimicrobiales bacterium]|nr:transcription-repair coupling factor [Acidimicrobiales bacterium]